MAGATSGGGNQNSAWALSSGLWAGEAAARRARRDGRRAGAIVYSAGRAGLRSGQAQRPVDAPGAVATARSAMGDIDKNMFRSGVDLASSLEVLDGVYAELAAFGQEKGLRQLRLREAVAQVAAARWSKAAALARPESRGMHRRSDAPTTDGRLAARQRVSGLDVVWTRFEATQPAMAAE